VVVDISVNSNGSSSLTESVFLIILVVHFETANEITTHVNITIIVTNIFFIYKYNKKPLFRGFYIKYYNIFRPYHIPLDNPYQEVVWPFL